MLTSCRPADAHPALAGAAPIRVRPKPTAFLSSLALRVREFAGLVKRDGSPDEPVANHLLIDEAIAEVDATDLPVVTIDIHDLNANDFTDRPGRGGQPAC